MFAIQATNPNDYARLNQHHVAQPFHKPHMHTATPGKDTKCLEEASNRYTMEATNKLSMMQVDDNYDTPCAPSDDAKLSYDYVPAATTTASDDYDYESPYWMPAAERRMLMKQLRKLGISSVTQMELE